MRLSLLVLFTFLLSLNSKAQFPPLEISADNILLTSTSATTVDVPIRAGTNWSNITALNGTITFDTSVVTFNQMSYWGLSNPGGAQFTDQGGGVLTYTWMSMITVGPTLNNNAIVFTLTFNVVGTTGQVSPITFTSSPQSQFWNNGFGWSGNNFTDTDGSVTIGCSAPTADWNSTASLLDVSFNDLTTGTPTSWAWDFGDGYTDNVQNPNHTYASSGTYTVCLTATDTCSSDMECKNITVSNCVNVYGTDTRTNCGPFTWIDGNTYLGDNNTATHTLVAGAANGCDSVVTLDLTVITNDKTVSQSTDTLTANLSGATYQWIDCDGNTSIAGATNQTYIATANGDYAVVVTKNGCTDTSACSNVSTISVSEHLNKSNFSIYPNPVKDNLTISFSNTMNQEAYEINMHNALGQSMLQFTTKGKVTNIDLSAFNDGLYFITIKNTKKITTLKFIKHQ